MHITSIKDDVLPVVKLGRDWHRNNWKMCVQLYKGNCVGFVDSSVSDSGQKGDYYPRETR